MSSSSRPRPTLFSAPHPDQSKLEQAIKDTFYNALVDFVLQFEGITQEQIPLALQAGIKNTILTILETSKPYPGIRLPIGITITTENCPSKYKSFFDALLFLKFNAPIDEARLDEMSNRIIQLESFQDLNPTEFILEAMGFAAPKLRNVQYDEEDITPDLIRRTFYNEMVPQILLAVENDWLTTDTLEDEDSKIYFALPALTILEAVMQSKQCNGIRLLNGKVVNNENCPETENFPVLVQLILSIKPRFDKITDQQHLVIKHLVCTDKELPDELVPLKKPELMELVTSVNNMAYQISQRRIFHTMVVSVIDMCLNSLKQESPAEASTSAPVAEPSSLGMRRN